MDELCIPTHVDNQSRSGRESVGLLDGGEAAEQLQTADELKGESGGVGELKRTRAADPGYEAAPAAS